MKNKGAKATACDAWKSVKKAIFCRWFSGAVALTPQIPANPPPTPIARTAQGFNNMIRCEIPLAWRAYAAPAVMASPSPLQ